MKATQTRWCLWVCGALLGLATPVEASFIRIGPYAFDLSLSSIFTATSNVDSLSEEAIERSGRDPEDVFVTYGFTMALSGSPATDTNTTISFGLSREKHFIRSDLDTDSENPILGTAVFSHAWNTGRLNYGVHVSYSAETEREKQDIFVPGVDEDGAPARNLRDVIQTFSYGGNVGYTAGRFNTSTSYLYEEEWHNDEFDRGDSESESINYQALYRISEIVSVSYSRQYERNILVNGVDQDDEFDITELIAINSAISGGRPLLSYSVGLEREDDNGEEGDWEVVHIFSASDRRQLGANLAVHGAVTYQLEEQEESDDISLVYNAGVNHRISRSVAHSLNWSREPVNTFGSTADADRTSVDYSFNIANFILREMTFGFTANYQKTRPKGEAAGTGTTETTNYQFLISKGIPLISSRHLISSTSYSYRYEIPDSGGDIEEHVLTLNLSYIF